MFKRVRGVVIAVKDLDGAVKKYQEVLGIKPVVQSEGGAEGVRGAHFPLGDSSIMLISPLRPGSSPAVEKFLTKRGDGLFMVSLEVTDINKVMKDIATKGARLVYEKPGDGPATKYNFVHPKSMFGVQLELSQKK